MNNKMRMSKYNMFTHDNEGNLLVYNFLKGLESITRVKKENIDAFTQLFIMSDEIGKEISEKYNNAVHTLMQSGILVYSDVNEEVLIDEHHCVDIFDSKLTLTILPTGKCNFRCPYCFETPQSFSRDTMTKEAQDAIIKYVQRNIPKHRALHISWFGGEPLVASDAIKYLSENFINICKKRYIPYSADVVTNGYFLDADMFDLLYSLKVYEYMITIDGFKEQHDRRRFTARGEGSYDVIMGNLMRIRDDKKYRFANIMIRINMSQGFLESMDEFVSFLAAEFGSDPRFKIMFVPVVKFANSDFPDNELYHDHKELFSHLNRNESYLKTFNYKENKVSSIVMQDKCPSALRNMYLIAPDLRIYKCNAHYDIYENFLGYMDLNGNMFLNEPLHKCWYMMRKVVRAAKERCKECFYLPCCPEMYSGCPVRYFKAKSDEISCPLESEEHRKGIEEAVKYVAENYNCIQLNMSLS